MKTRLLIPLFIFTNLYGILAQTGDLPDSKRLFKTWVTMLDGTDKKKGVLYEVRDSTVILSSSTEKTDYFNVNRYELTKVDIKNIDVIATRRNKGIGQGALIGGLSGALLGVILGVTSTNTAENEKANAGIKVSSTIAATIFMGTCGAVIGTALGTIRRKIHLHGSQEKFEQRRERLNNRSLTYNPLIAGQKLTIFSRLSDTVVDFDGNVYHTVAIGSMVFMAENLRVTHFRNGKSIPLVHDTAGWRKADGAACCNYLHDSAKVASFGRLYNGFAMSDTAGLCPDGWHVPTVVEWTSLVLCLGGNDHAGGYLKEDGNSHWSKPNNTMLTGNNFALPSGSRDRKGTFAAVGRTCNWWAAREHVQESFQGLNLGNESTLVKFISPDKNAGLSVRCIRN